MSVTFGNTYKKKVFYELRSVTLSGFTVNGICVFHVER